MTKIPRHLLPQIPATKLPEFVSHLREAGIRSGLAALPVIKLKPIQAHVNREKIENLKQKSDLIKKPLIVTREGYIVDGHHRWIALKENSVAKVPCLVCMCSLREILELAHNFDHSYVKSVHEVTTYGRLALLRETIREEISGLH
jgi:hypothetical protein